VYDSARLQRPSSPLTNLTGTEVVVGSERGKCLFSLQLVEGQRKGSGVGLPLAVARTAKMAKRADEGGLAICSRGSGGKVGTVFISQGLSTLGNKPSTPSPFLFTLFRLSFHPTIVRLTPNHIFTSGFVHQFIARKIDSDLSSLIFVKGGVLIHTSIITMSVDRSQRLHISSHLCRNTALLLFWVSGSHSVG
jgi:hypothetical protein